MSGSIKEKAKNELDYKFFSTRSTLTEEKAISSIRQESQKDQTIICRASRFTQGKRCLKKVV